MIPVKPESGPDGSTEVTFGANQSGVHSLPAFVDIDGVVMTEWEPSADELHRLFTGARVRLWVKTCGAPLQPVMLEVTELTA